MSDKKESLSKRQARKEELRRKERQQRIIVIGAVLLIAVALIGLVIVPSIQSAMNPGGDFVRITPQAYTTADGTRLGNPDAKVKIEVFEDFKCSACKIYTKNIEPDVIKNLVETGEVYYVHHMFPFLDDNASTKDSDRAALAAECAADQNRYWDYKEILFENQKSVPGEFSDERLIAFAESLKLDMNQFNACYSQKTPQPRIDESLALGLQMGVQGTPSVFVNGVEVSPGKVPTFEQILQAVQLASAGN